MKEIVFRISGEDDNLNMTIKGETTARILTQVTLEIFDIVMASEQFIPYLAVLLDKLSSIDDRLFCEAVQLIENAIEGVILN